MKIKQIFSLAVFCFLAMPVFVCASPSSATGAQKLTLGTAELEEIFTAVFSRESMWPIERISISGFSAHPESISIPAGIIDYRLENRVDPGRMGRQSLQVTLLVNGREQGRVRMSANIQQVGTVLVAARRINRGEILSESDLVAHKREISMLGSSFIDDPELAVGKQLRTTLQPGAIVYENLLENPTILMRGSRVNIRVRADNIRVSVLGEAREPGAAGDLVRVRNLTSRQEIVARVIDGSTVEVDI